MIHEVDEALRRLVRDDALRGTDVEVAFDAPTKDWAARRNAPTVDVYLYDIREDLRRRLPEPGWEGQLPPVGVVRRPGRLTARLRSGPRATRTPRRARGCAAGTGW
nr:Pvc16 family protein [Saccharothrix sp. S26]